MLELLGGKFDEKKIYFHYGLMMLEDGRRQIKARYVTIRDLATAPATLGLSPGQAPG